MKRQKTVEVMSASSKAAILPKNSRKKRIPSFFPKALKKCHALYSQRPPHGLDIAVQIVSIADKKKDKFFQILRYFFYRFASSLLIF
jgi:hypothetical protein